MKKILLSTVLLGLVLMGQAQTTPSKKKPVAKSSVKATKLSATKSIVVLNSTSTNNAYTPSSIGRLQIADTNINFMNHRAAGANISFGKSAIAGMPKGTYGFANGKISLRNTTATTSGSAYGSGAGVRVHPFTVPEQVKVQLELMENLLMRVPGFGVTGGLSTLHRELIQYGGNK